MSKHLNWGKKWVSKDRVIHLKVVIYLCLGYLLIAATTSYGTAQNKAEVHFYRGCELYTQGSLMEAEREFREAIALNPNLTEAYFNLGCMLIKEGKLKEAENALILVTQLSPDFAGGHLNLGIVLVVEERFGEADKPLRRAIQLDPNSAEAHASLGLVLKKEGKNEEALREYQEAIRLNPDLQLARSNFGILLYDQKKYDEAEKELREAIRIDPNNGIDHCNLGLALSQQGKLQEAEKEFQVAIQINSKDSISLKTIKIVQDKLKYNKEWREHPIQKVLELAVLPLVILLIIYLILKNRKKNKLKPTTNIAVNANKADIVKPKAFWLRFWIIIVGVLLVGTYAAMFIPAFAGHSVKPQAGYSSMFWTGLFFYLLWKRLARKGWHGALVGVIVGVLVFCVAAFVEGFMRRGAGP